MDIQAQLTTPATDRAAISIRDLTQACLDKFDEALASQGHPPGDGLENRKADFSPWADGIGATANPGASTRIETAGSTR